MKLIGPLLLLITGGVLAWIGLRAEDPTYVAPVDESPETVPFELSGAVPKGSTVRAFEVEGICCEGCSGKLYAALDAVEGVHEIAVDTVRNRVEVVADSSLGVADLGATLTFGKYTAKEAAAGADPPVN